MNSNWSLVRIDKILKLQRRWIQLEPLKQYQEIGLRSFGKGIFHKTPVYGADLGSKRVLEIHPRDLILSNVFAWEGAVGVATEAERGMIGSHRFITYTPIDNSCSVEYLQLFFHSPEGLEVIRKVSPGSAGRNRTLNLKQFDKAMIPLPPIAEQRRIVARVEELAAQIGEARGLRERAITQLDALLKAERRAIFGDHPRKDWVKLSNIIKDIENGKSPACEKRPANPGEWGVFKVGVVSLGFYKSDENKALPPGIKPEEKHEVKIGDFLMSRANTTELVGSCAVVSETRPKLLLSDKIFRFIFKAGVEMEPTYLDQALKSPALRDQIERAASGTSSSMKNISKKKVFELLVPTATLDEQKSVVERLQGIQAKVTNMKKIREDALQEFDALLPAILDKAFKGEL